MENAELTEKLTARGFTIGAPRMRADGTILLLVNDVFMVLPDAADLANGDVTLEQIIARYSH